MNAEPEVLTLQITMQIRAGSIRTRTQTGARGEFSGTLNPYLYTWKLTQLGGHFETRWRTKEKSLPVSPPAHYAPIPAREPTADQRPKQLGYFYLLPRFFLVFVFVLFFRSFNHHGNEVSTLIVILFQILEIVDYLQKDFPTELR